jgi:hypothetical protein
MGNRWGRRTGGRVLAAMLAMSSIALAACGGAGSGGSGPTLSRTAFTQKANTECSILKAASNDLAQTQDPSMKGVQVTKFLHLASGKLRLLVRRVDALAPPDSLSGDVDTLLSLLGRYADGLDKLGNRVKAGETFQITLNGNGALVNTLNGYADRATNLAAKIGIAGCILAA